jgi:hypothetical protein
MNLASDLAMLGAHTDSWSPGVPIAHSQQQSPAVCNPHGNFTVFTPMVLWQPLPAHGQAAQLPHLQSNDLIHVKCSKCELGAQASFSLEPRRSCALHGFRESAESGSLSNHSQQGADSEPSGHICQGVELGGAYADRHVCAHTWKLLISLSPKGHCLQAR